MTFDARAWLWFLSSYGPLWLMLGLRFDALPLRIAFFSLGAVSIALVAHLLSRRAKERPTSTSVTITGDAGGEVGGYLATYLLPFLTVADPAWTDLLAYGIFIVVAGLIYTRSDLMQINPTVYVLGRRVQRASVLATTGQREVFVITSERLAVGTTLRGERFADRVFVDHNQGAP